MGWKILVAFALLSSGLFAQEEEGPRRRPARRGEAAGYSSRDATVLSMMGWGIGLTVGIASLFALLDNNATSGGGGGHNGHS